MVVFVVFNGLLFGFDMGIILGVFFYIRDVFMMMLLVEGIVVSGVLVGVVFGVVFGGYFVD